MHGFRFPRTFLIQSFIKRYVKTAGSYEVENGWSFQKLKNLQTLKIFSCFTRRILLHAKAIINIKGIWLKALNHF